MARISVSTARLRAARVVLLALSLAAVAGAWLIAYGEALPSNGTAWGISGVALLAAAFGAAGFVLVRWVRRRPGGHREFTNARWVVATALFVLAAAILASGNGILAGHEQKIIDVTTASQVLANLGTFLGFGAGWLGAYAAMKTLRRTEPGEASAEQNDGDPVSEWHRTFRKITEDHAAGRIDRDSLILQLDRLGPPPSTHTGPDIQQSVRLDPPGALGNGHVPSAVPGVPRDPTVRRPLGNSARRDSERIGDYIIDGLLGEGGMGRVYLGHTEGGQQAAVKVLHDSVAQAPGFDRRLFREALAAMVVRSEFTASLVAFNSHANPPWLATEYIPAPSLEELVTRCGPLSSAVVFWIARGCVAALEAIHAAGFIHRDMKPSNVLVTMDGARVIDFGIVRAADNIGLTAVGAVIGTPQYMSPEQAQGDQVSASSDIYSLGVTLLFAATGHAAHSSWYTSGLLSRLATVPPDLSGLPSELAPLITACLHRDPAERPTLAEMRSQLEARHPTQYGNHLAGLSHLPLSVPLIDIIRSYQDRDGLNGHSIPPPQSDRQPSGGDSWTSGDDDITDDRRTGTIFLPPA
jgi:serine/threonine protein kinase